MMIARSLHLLHSQISGTLEENKIFWNKVEAEMFETNSSSNIILPPCKIITVQSIYRSNINSKNPQSDNQTSVCVMLPLHNVHQLSYDQVVIEWSRIIYSDVSRPDDVVSPFARSLSLNVRVTVTARFLVYE